MIYRNGENEMVELIYTRLIFGGIGYSPKLYRSNGKYYTVRGDTDPENYRKLSEMNIPESKSNRPNHLWIKHQYDNTVTAGEFLKIIESKGVKS